jgi:hypothetical protein
MSVHALALSRGLFYLRGHMRATIVLTDDATVAEIDEALGYARQLPADQRGAAWHAFVDRLLEMRAQKNTGALWRDPFKGDDDNGAHTNNGAPKPGLDYDRRHTRVMGTPEAR